MRWHEEELSKVRRLPTVRLPSVPVKRMKERGCWFGLPSTAGILEALLGESTLLSAQEPEHLVPEI